jgi:ABC-type nitrate/sulfonate/bicarbonate transport system substrate-binding protein
MLKALEDAIAKIRALPEDRQQLAAELLEELASGGDLYELSEDEKAALKDGLERSDRGEFVSEDRIAAFWKKAGL